MNENNININEEVKEPIYTSNSVMTRDFFYDFSSVSYNRMKKILLVFLCFSVFEIVLNIIVGNYDIVASTLFISFLMFILYLKGSRATKLNYERNLISAGKEATLSEELFEDKIVSGVDELKREYLYTQVTRFFETKNFLLLHLQHHLYITVNKNNLNANVDEVKSFLIQKCPLVKKKKFVNCSNDKTLSLIFLIALITASVIGTVVSLVLKTNTLFL